MKRSEIISALGELENDSSNIRGWLDAVDAKIAALRERLAEPAPTQIEYDRTQLDEPPRPKQPSFNTAEAPECKCGDPAKRLEKEGRNGKPYVAWACPNPKATGCDFWVFDNQLQKA